MKKPRARAPNIITLPDAMNDRHLFARWFARSPQSWAAWRAFVAALFALPMAAEQLAIFRECTGRTEAPTSPAQEAWLVCGRRSGKSFILALIAVYLAAFRDFRPYLAPGERGTVLVTASDKKQARVIIRYVRGLLTNVPMLARMVAREDRESFDLRNATTIEICAASFKATRGYTVVAALCDEIAFWPIDDSSAEPDREVLAALRPGMATIPGAMLLCASSPYARKGALWDAHRRHYGKDGDPILVWQAPTRTMNPSVPQRVIDEAMERDPASAAAEYGAQFRSDIESFVAREAVAACVEAGVFEREPEPGVSYCAFVDPSGGSADSMTMAIAHRANDQTVIDAIREVRPPFSPESVVSEFAALLRRYGVAKIVGDRFAGEWPRERFAVHGVEYEASAKPKSDLYRDLLPAINSRGVVLLDHEKLLNQLTGLERRTARGGRDSIDHAPGAHDDIANAAAGVVAMLAEDGTEYDQSLSWVGEPNERPRSALAQRMSLYTLGFR